MHKHGHNVLVAFTVFMVTTMVYANMYITQPIVQVIQENFQTSMQKATLTLSVVPLTIGLTCFFYGPFSDRLGRRPIILAACWLLVIPTAICSLVNSVEQLILLRALQGLIIPGAIAILLTYVSEEFPGIRGLMVGIYLAATIFGGLAGRLASGLITEVYGWRTAFLLFALGMLLASLLAAFFLPPSRHFVPSKNSGLGVKQIPGLLRHLPLKAAFLVAFTNFYAFVAIFTYLPFLASNAPYHLNLWQISLLFSSYVAGIVASPLAGQLSDRWGRKKVMIAGLVIAITGNLLTVAGTLPLLVIGLFTICGGMFAAHSAASSLVGDQGGPIKGTAISLYQVFYYMGGTAGAGLPALAWETWQWSSVLLPNLFMLGLSLLATLLLVPPKSPNTSCQPNSQNDVVPDHLQQVERHSV